MGKYVPKLLLVSFLVSAVGCGGSSGGSDAGNSVNNKVVRSLTSGSGSWESTADVPSDCKETWVFAAGYTVASLNLNADGDFSFTEEVISGDRHLLVFTETNNDNEQACPSSSYANLPDNKSFYLNFNTVDQFDVYTSATGGTSLGVFDRQATAP